MTRCPSGPQARLFSADASVAASTAPAIAIGPTHRIIVAPPPIAAPPPCDHASIGESQMSAEEEEMRGVVFTGDRQLEMMNFPDPTPGEGEVVVEMKASGMCGSGPAYGALRRIRISGNDTIAIFGQGPVGLSATQLASAMGARVIALDVSEERLDRAKEFGAAETVNPRSNDPVGAIKDLTHGYGAEFTLDTSSQPEGRIAAVRATKVWGTTCFVGERNQVTIDVSPDMLRKQLTIVASWTFSQMGQAECAQFVVDRKIDVEKLFTHQWKLEQAEEAYKLFDTQTTGKGVFLI